MDETEFWRLISCLDWRHEGDDERVVEPVVRDLAKRPPEDFEAFDEILAQKLYAIDGRAWAREMGEGWWGGEVPVSTDVFLYARCAVVANGREFYEGVLANPRAMPKDLDFESLLSLTGDAWERKTGDEYEGFDTSVSYETYSNGDGWPPAPPEPEVVRSSVAREPFVMWRGRDAVRGIVRRLLTGDLADPVLSAYLDATIRMLVMTPGDGVNAPEEDAKHRYEGGPGPEWRARIRLWAAPLGDASSRQPTGLVAVIRLRRVSPERVEGELVVIEPEA